MIETSGKVLVTDGQTEARTVYYFFLIQNVDSILNKIIQSPNKLLYVN